jgi:[acyl-carrier-protein] S-malonyltransferase
MGTPWRDSSGWPLVTTASEAAHTDVAHLLCDADADELTRTDNAQLATFVLSLVVFDQLTRAGVRPAVVAGHSLGEYSALVAAGALGFTDGVRLVAERGAAMAAAAATQPGTMAAVLGLDPSIVDEACRSVSTNDSIRAWMANDNGSGQVVIAGTVAGIEAATAEARTRGARKVLPLAVGGAFHTPLMAPAAERLRLALTTTSFSDSTIAVVTNVDATPHHLASDWPVVLHEQLCRPVRWRETLGTLVELGVDRLIEVGPGTALSGMAKRSAPTAEAISVSTPDSATELVRRLGVPGDPVEGEHLHGAERMVVSPTAGVFHPAEGITPGIDLRVGQSIGTVNGDVVRSPFGGRVAGYLAHPGERVTPTQPLAWLRTADGR